MEKIGKKCQSLHVYSTILPDTFIWHSRAMPYIIYWFIGWRFSSRSLSSAGFNSEISFLFSLQTRSVWSSLFSSPLLSSEEEDEDDEGSCWTLIWTSLSEDEISQLITLNSLINEQTRINEYGGKIFSLITYKMVVWCKYVSSQNARLLGSSEYRKVASSRLVYYSILNSFDQRSQYISINFPLYKQSENP